MSPDPEVPADVLAVDTGTRSVAMRVSALAYPVDAIYGASYLFLDRAWVLLDRPDPSHVRITLSWRGEPAEGALSAAVEEFAEELVSCAWRAGVAKEGRALIEAATAKAHSGVEVGPDRGPSLDDLTSYEFSGGTKVGENAEALQKQTAPGPSNEEAEQLQSPKEGS